jgi:hypothetical protein
MATETLLFDTPEFENFSPLSTTRLGPKWFDKVSIGDRVQLRETGGEVLGTAEVLGVSLAPFDKAPIGWVARNHLTEVTSRYDLAQVMSEIYEDFDTASPCTTILFDADLRDE